MEGWIKIRPLTVFRRDVDWCPWPDYAETGIVKANTVFFLRRVKCVRQVERLGVVRQRYKTVSEALRRVHHQAILCGEFGAEPLSEGCRIWPKIDNDVI